MSNLLQCSQPEAADGAGNTAAQLVSVKIKFPAAATHSSSEGPTHGQRDSGVHSTKHRVSNLRQCSQAAGGARNTAAQLVVTKIKLPAAAATYSSSSAEGMHTVTMAECTAQSTVYPTYRSAVRLLMVLGTMPLSWLSLMSRFLW